MKNNNIKYTPAGIVITIPSNDPELTYSQILHSIVCNIEYSTLSNDKHLNYGDEMLPLIGLLKVMLPGAD